jgi:RHS repeat-associated protein
MVSGGATRRTAYDGPAKLLGFDGPVATTACDLADNTGAIVDHVDYSAYGQVLAESAPGVGDRLKFTGREWDAATGLPYNRARHNDPAAGRWLSQDPIGFAAGDANLYRYVGNGSPNATDPTGEWSWGGALGGIVGGALAGGAAVVIIISLPVSAPIIATTTVVGIGLGAAGGAVGGGIAGGVLTNDPLSGAAVGAGVGLVTGPGTAIFGPAVVPGLAVPGKIATNSPARQKALDQLNNCWNSGMQQGQRPARGGGTGLSSAPSAQPRPRPPIQQAPPATRPTTPPVRRPTWEGLGPKPRPVPGACPKDLAPKPPPTTSWLPSWLTSWWPF